MFSTLVTQYVNEDVFVNTLMYANKSITYHENIKPVWGLGLGCLVQRIHYLTTTKAHYCIKKDGRIYCRLTDDQVAKHLRCSRRKVSYMKRFLVDAGFIAIEYDKRDNATLYTLLKNDKPWLLLNAPKSQKIRPRKTSRSRKNDTTIKDISSPNGEEKKYKTKKDFTPTITEEGNVVLTSQQQRVADKVDEVLMKPNGIERPSGNYWLTHVINFVAFFSGDDKAIDNYIELASRSQFLNPHLAAKTGFKGAGACPTPYTFLKLTIVQNLLKGFYNPVEAPPILEDTPTKLTSDIQQYIRDKGETPNGDSVESLTMQAFSLNVVYVDENVDKNNMKKISNIRKFKPDEQMQMVKRHIFESGGTPITYAARRFVLENYGAVTYADLLANGQTFVRHSGVIVCTNDFMRRVLEERIPLACEKYGVEVEDRRRESQKCEPKQTVNETETFDFDALRKLLSSPSDQVTTTFHGY